MVNWNNFNKVDYYFLSPRTTPEEFQSIESYIFETAVLRKWMLFKGYKFYSIEGNKFYSLASKN